MPSVPKWLGDTMENLFSGLMHPVTVTNVIYHDKRLKKVRFEGDLKKTKFSPGNVVEFRVNEKDYRHYTPSVFDSENGFCEILFYLHDHGPGSRWAENLKAGDTVRLMGPGGKMKYNPENQYHVLFGDETSLSFFQCIKDVIHKNGQEYFCFFESDKEHSNWVDIAGISAETCEKFFDHPAEDAIRHLEEFINLESKCWSIWQHATFYLTGRARSIQAFRKTLNSKGIKNSQIRTEPYWAEGKNGL